MMRTALIANVSRLWVALSVLNGLPALAAPDSRAEGDSDTVTVSAVKTYQAKQIASGEQVGLFLLVDANVRISAKTRAQLAFARAHPIVLTVRLNVNDKHYLPCGGALGNLAGPFPLGLVRQLESAGEPISPIFYIPEGSLGDANVVELLTVLQVVDGNWPESPEVPAAPALARSIAPWTQDLLVGASAAPVEFIGVEREERTDYKKTMGATRMMKSVRLHLPEGLLRVVFAGKVYCGPERAEDLTVEDPFVARFAAPIDPLNCSWEIRFPDFGVKMELEMSRQESEP